VIKAKKGCMLFFLSKLGCLLVVIAPGENSGFKATKEVVHGCMRMFCPANSGIRFV
jgi:hypothetical protein